jgi:hypothetical protein
LQPASAAEQDSRLTRNLRKHRGADVALRAGATDEFPELVDAIAMVGNPLLDAAIDVPAAAPAEKLDPQLLEISRQAGGQ